MKTYRHHAAAAVAALALCAPLSALTISEINYNPAAGDEALEFIEISNETWVPDDLSGYSFSDGIEYVFPPGTILLGQESLVVCANVEAFMARYRTDDSKVFGPWTGRLDSGGERVALANHVGIELVSTRFRDGGKWPVAPDGTGHTLVLRELYLDPGEPESWDQSPELGGSPGRPNFPSQREIEYEFTEYLAPNVTWAFRIGTGAYSDPPDAWTLEDFDDAAWERGEAPIGFGEDFLGTVLEDVRNVASTVAIRTRFTLTREQIEARGEIFLGMLFDDGFCAYLNGERVSGANCPDDPVFDAIATRTSEARTEGAFPIDRASLRAGENVFAILGLNRPISSGDLVLGPRLYHRRALVDFPPIEFDGRFNELARPDGESAGWVELYNPTSAPILVAGARLTDDPDRPDPYVLPPKTVIPAEGFLVVSSEDADLDLSQPRVRVFLIQDDGRVLTATVFERAAPDGGPVPVEARFPDGDARDWATETATPGAANVVDAPSDLVINELFYHPPEDRDGEFIELFNRGVSAIDASGFRFSKGIGYTIPDGTVVPPGGYLVISNAPELVAERHGIEGVLGPYEGELANGGENVRLLDASGNLVDEVRYHDGGRWSLWADGRGASLELIDPWQDNDVASAWDASDESAKSEWREYSYSVRYAPAGQSELHLLLVERGICRIDDVRVTREGDPRNHIPNPSFETGTSPWRIEGTHIGSHRVSGDGTDGDVCLEIVATGKGDSTCNRIETDTSPALGAANYTVSLQAKWLRGSSLLVAHGEFAPGPWFGTRDNNMSNNSLGGRVRLDVPLNLGSPGAENSVRVRLREETGGVNLGPVIDRVRHDPPIPDADMPIDVVARISDADGVARAVALVRRDSASEFNEIELHDDGAHRDGLAGDGLYGGRLGAFGLGVYVFAIEATDSLGATRRFPVDAPEQVLTISVGAVQEAAFLVQNVDSVRELASRTLHSNDLVDGTFVYDNKEIYYNAGLRYRGSPWGRPARQSLRVAWPKDKPFIGDRTTMNLSNRDRGDGAPQFLVSRNSEPGSIAPALDYRYIRFKLNRQSWNQPGIVDTVDRDFLEKWYGADAVENMVALKGNGRLRFSDSCQRSGWDEATMLHMDESSENYRFYYNHSVHQTRDNWQPWMDVTRAIDRRTTPDAEVDAAIAATLDVERFFRVIGPRIIMSDGDALYVGNGHNGYNVWDPLSGLWSHVPFDMGFAFSSVTTNIYGLRDRNLSRVLSRPKYRRLYTSMMYEYMNGYWNDEVAGPYLTALQRASGVGNSAIGFLRTSRRSILAALNRFTSPEFAIRNNDGMDFVSEEPTVVIEGSAPVQVRSFALQRGADDFEFFEPDIVSAGLVVWRHEFELRAGANQLEFFGFDHAGSLVGTTGITISTGVSFVRGDANEDAVLNISDPVYILRALFAGGALGCEDAADVDDSGAVNLTDAVALLEFLYRRGARPAAPFPNRGADPTDDELGCES